MAKIKLQSIDKFIPHLSFDSVIFGFNRQQLKILILEYHKPGLFALVADFVKRNENLNDAVKRALSERIALDNFFGTT